MWGFRKDFGTISVDTLIQNEGTGKRELQRGFWQPFCSDSNWKRRKWRHGAPERILATITFRFELNMKEMEVWAFGGF